MRKPKLNALRMFDAAARHLNFGRAADELNLTQGAVAQQIRLLEADLGCLLFVRKARGLTFTPQGAAYHRQIRKALAIIDEATGNLLPAATTVSISVPPSFATKWLVPRLAEFQSAHPDIDLKIIASERLADFSTDDIDIAVRQSHRAEFDGLEADKLAPLALCAVCSPQQASEIGSIDGLQTFADYRLLQDSHGHWETVFTSAGLETPAKMMTFNQTALAMDAAAADNGIALVPRLLLDTDLSRGALAIVWQSDQPVPDAYYVVIPARSAANSAARDRVKDWLLSRCAGTGQMESSD